MVKQCSDFDPQHQFSPSLENIFKQISDVVSQSKPTYIMLSASITKYYEDCQLFPWVSAQILSETHLLFLKCLSYRKGSNGKCKYIVFQNYAEL